MSRARMGGFPGRMEGWTRVPGAGLPGSMSTVCTWECDRCGRRAQAVTHSLSQTFLMQDHTEEECDLVGRVMGS